ncbi:MAG: di-trans,poly-cis-decaprenylcistransferase [Ruminococcaceae bacterium]|nr:di-trans,poly-cis-decaprenylcistransferase [Oscillospiraceae bacterium]
MKKEAVVLKDSNKAIRHIAFIMDGNGRWAKRRGMPREFGHKNGAETFKRIMRRCCELGIEASTFYVFSTENWKRPQREIDAILSLLDRYLDDCEQEIKTNDVRFIFIGDLSVFSVPVQEKMKRIEEFSKNNSHIVNLALNYGGRNEIATAVNSLIKAGMTVIDEDDITGALYTKESPPLDLIVRTGGDLRISNFLLWQAAYAEFYFTDKLWPELVPDDVNEIIDNFTNRSRRFGGV